MKRFWLAAPMLLLCFAGGAFAVPVQNSILQNGSFDLGVPVSPCYLFALPAGSTAIPGWTVSVGDVDWVGPCNWTAQDGTHSLDLLGNGKIGGVQQTFNTILGATYQVAFGLAGNPGPVPGNPPVKPLTVTVAGVTQSYTFDVRGHSTTNMGWTTKTFTFVATAATSTINFVSDMTAAAGGFAGAALDNVNVFQIGDAPATPWTGSAGSVTNPGQGGVAIASAPTVVSDGTAGSAFTYETVNSYCCHTGDWTFQTTATSAGDVARNWTYSGYHGTCQATASLTAFVKRGGSIIFSSTPYSASDAACNGALPAGGFGEYGQVVFPGVIAGDTYGFMMHASNYDSNGGVLGRLTVTTGTMPTTTTVGTSASPVPYGVSVDFTATVTGSAPTGSVTFTQEGRIMFGCVAIPLAGGSAMCSTNGLAPGNRNIVALYTGDTVNAGSVSAPLTQVINAAAPALAAPSLIRVVEDLGGSSTFVIGRVDNAPPPGTLVQAFTATSCVGGAPAGVSPIGSPVPLTTTDGYFGATVTGVTSGQFLALKLTTATGTPISDASSCLPSLGNNDFWTTALLLGGENTSAGSSSVGDYIDAPGKTRWYRFKVAPGQRIAVILSGLPADYDLTVFKDIGAAFAAQLAPADSAALTKLSAEFAPSAFSPSAFSPSAFSPSAFSPSAFSPSAFSPSAFSPSAFSPSAFSPSAFSPSAFSPSAFSPSAFSPSAFSPSAFSPSAFSPSAFSPSAFSVDVINTAFSSAQTRSIIAVSATPGTGDESAVVDSWNNSGYFYARVTGRGGAFSTAGQFNIGVAKGATSCAGVSPLPPAPRTAPGPNYTTVILTDSSRLVDDGTLAGKLVALAGRSEIAGVVVDVAGDTRVGQLKTQAAANNSCPYATNLVAEEIKSIVDSYRNPNLRYVVIAGGDDVIPFFRYPDESLLGQESGYVPPVTGVSDASLRGDYVLSQDAYGSKTRISLRTSDFPIPGLAVGRLVKTPAEIAGMIDAYTTATAADGTTVQPRSSLVTGYDFLADVAGAVVNELQSGTGSLADKLIAANGVAPQDSWKATDLGTALFTRRHDVVFLAGHFSANSALAADFATNLITSDLAASTTDFTNSIVFSAGCHSGYSIVNRDAITGATFTLDWAQAFAQKKATLIAGTGYQYGDTDFIEYSERLYLNFAKELHAGTGPVAVGQALVKAKLDYLAATPDIRGIHTKALLESTLYGLPMLGVNMPSGRGVGGSVLAGVIAAAPVAAPAPAARLGLRIADLHLNSNDLATTLQTQQLTGADKTIPGPLASWLSGNVDGVVSNPAEPALPLKVVNVTPIDGTIVLRGVGFRGGSYGDSTVVPLTGAPATEIRGVHVSFASPYFFPMRPWTVNYFGALAGNGATSLLVTPAQHRAADLDPAGTGAMRSTLRSFSNLDLRLYYSGNYGNDTKQVSLSDAPTIVSVGAQPAATGGVTFTAQVTGDPAAAIHQVWVMYTNGGTWVPVDLAQCIGTSLPPACGTTTDSQIWKGTDASAPAGSLQFVVQAANGLGLVAFDDNRGAYYTFTGTVAPPEAASTALSFVAAPATASYGDAVSVTAQLTSNGAPVGGSIVTVNIGGMGNAGTTGPDGHVRFDAVVANAPGNYQIEASYLGTSTMKPTSVKRSFVVSAAPASLALLPSPAIGVNLTAPVANGNVTTYQPVAAQSVSFLLTGPGISQTVVVNTDTAGNATLPTAGLPAGTYSIAASFLPASVAGSVTNYAGATLALPTFVMNAQSIALTTPAAVTYAAPGTFAVSAAVSPNPNSSQSITITSTTPTVCTVTGSPAANQANYTATIITAGEAATQALCKLTAQVAGNNTFAPAKATATIAISKAAQTIAFNAPATLTYLQSTSLPTLTDAAAIQPITYTVTGQCSIAANVITANSGTGSCTIAATALGTPLYSAYSNSSFASITLAKATLIVSPTVSPSSFTYGDDLAPPPITVTYGSPMPYSGTLACLLNSTPPTYTGKPPAAPATAGPYTITATLGAGQLSPSCNLVTNTATLTVNRAQATFASIAASLTVPARTTVSITGQLNRLDKPQIYPKAADLGGGAFAVALRNSAGTVKTYAPSLSDPNGTFTITDNSLAPDTYALEFNYTGGANFLAATKFVSSLRVVGFASSGSMSQARTSHTATLLNDGRVLVAGGVSVTDDRLRGNRTAEIYCPDPYTPPAAPARTLAQWCPNGVGKFSPAGRGNTTQIGIGNMVQARAFHTATLLPDGTVLLTGGYNQSDIFTSTAEIYDATDPIADRFTAVGSLPSIVLIGHTATLISKNGKALVLVAGGGTASSQLYDPATKIWSRSGAMTGARLNHTASRVGVGGTKVLVAGGIDLQGKTLQTTTIYDVGTGTFSSGPTMLAPRQLHTATAIANGKVLLAGGTGGSNNTVALSPLAEIYDPANATTPFVPTGFASNTGRFAHSASALGAANAPDGRVLIAGGSVGIACGQVLAASELYTLGFASGAAMTAARVSHTATVLKDGRVLIAGGIGAAGSTCAPLNTTEIWNAPPTP